MKNLMNHKPDEGRVVLTFDDGPGRHLAAILDILKEKAVPAVFFWNTRLLYDQRPWRRVIDEGHLIGSHSHKHVNLTSLNQQKQYDEIKTSIDRIESITGQRVRYFRPPFGQFNEDTVAVLKSLDLTPVMWEITSYDWENKAEPGKTVCNVIDHVKAGSIILLHELEQTVEVLPELIDRLREEGYDFTLI
ncbi:polysaccharide deacetylase family protein [Mesobacillus harenae]|uniref:polysaccharide deacetylase family protein n=1 Tax=Mesobacillus harenae TaxID=2213203 RepID=UPI0015808377|nr:polysaccharide deacetylase family protein [Mesobacillus harenae]